MEYQGFNPKGIYYIQLNPNGLVSANGNAQYQPSGAGNPQPVYGNSNSPSLLPCPYPGHSASYSPPSPRQPQPGYTNSYLPPSNQSNTIANTAPSYQLYYLSNSTPSSTPNSLENSLSEHQLYNSSNSTANRSVPPYPYSADLRNIVVFGNTQGFYHRGCWYNCGLYLPTSIAPEQDQVQVPQQSQSYVAPMQPQHPTTPQVNQQARFPYAGTPRFAEQDQIYELREQVPPLPAAANQRAQVFPIGNHIPPPHPQPRAQDPPLTGVYMVTGQAPLQPGTSYHYQEPPQPQHVPPPEQVPLIHGYAYAPTAAPQVQAEVLATPHLGYKQPLRYQHVPPASPPQHIQPAQHFPPPQHIPPPQQVPPTHVSTHAPPAPPKAQAEVQPTPHLVEIVLGPSVAVTKTEDRIIIDLRPRCPRGPVPEHQNPVKESQQIIEVIQDNPHVNSFAHPPSGPRHPIPSWNESNYVTRNIPVDASVRVPMVHRIPPTIIYHTDMVQDEESAPVTGAANLVPSPDFSCPAQAVDMTVIQPVNNSSQVPNMVMVENENVEHIQPKISHHLNMIQEPETVLSAIDYNRDYNSSARARDMTVIQPENNLIQAPNFIMVEQEIVERIQPEIVNHPLMVQDPSLTILPNTVPPTKASDFVSNPYQNSPVKAVGSVVIQEENNIIVIKPEIVERIQSAIQQQPNIEVQDPKSTLQPITVLPTKASDLVPNPETVLSAIDYNRDYNSSARAVDMTVIQPENNLIQAPNLIMVEQEIVERIQPEIVNHPLMVQDPSLTILPNTVPPTKASDLVSNPYQKSPVKAVGSVVIQEGSNIIVIKPEIVDRIQSDIQNQPNIEVQDPKSTLQPITVLPTKASDLVPNPRNLVTSSNKSDYGTQNIPMDAAVQMPLVDCIIPQIICHTILTIEPDTDLPTKASDLVPKPDHNSSAKAVDLTEESSSNQVPNSIVVQQETGNQESHNSTLKEEEKKSDLDISKKDIAQKQATESEKQSGATLLPHQNMKLESHAIADIRKGMDQLQLPDPLPDLLPEAPLTTYIPEPTKQEPITSSQITNPLKEKNSQPASLEKNIITNTQQPANKSEQIYPTPEENPASLEENIITNIQQPVNKSEQIYPTPEENVPKLPQEPEVNANQWPPLGSRSRSKAAPKKEPISPENTLQQSGSVNSSRYTCRLLETRNTNKSMERRVPPAVESKRNLTKNKRDLVMQPKVTGQNYQQGVKEAHVKPKGTETPNQSLKVIKTKKDLISQPIGLDPQGNKENQPQAIVVKPETPPLNGLKNSSDIISQPKPILRDVNQGNCENLSKVTKVPVPDTKSLNVLKKEKDMIAQPKVVLRDDRQCKKENPSKRTVTEMEAKSPIAPQSESAANVKSSSQVKKPLDNKSSEVKLPPKKKLMINSPPKTNDKHKDSVTDSKGSTQVKNPVSTSQQKPLEKIIMNSPSTHHKPKEPVTDSKSSTQVKKPLKAPQDNKDSKPLEIKSPATKKPMLDSPPNIQHKPKEPASTDSRRTSNMFELLEVDDEEVGQLEEPEIKADPQRLGNLKRKEKRRLKKQETAKKNQIRSNKMAAKKAAIAEKEKSEVVKPMPSSESFVGSLPESTTKLKRIEKNELGLWRLTDITKKYSMPESPTAKDVSGCKPIEPRPPPGAPVPQPAPRPPGPPPASPRPAPAGSSGPMIANNQTFKSATNRKNATLSRFMNAISLAALKKTKVPENKASADGSKPTTAKDSTPTLRLRPQMLTKEEVKPCQSTLSVETAQKTLKDSDLNPFRILESFGFPKSQDVATAKSQLSDSGAQESTLTKLSEVKSSVEAAPEVSKKVDLNPFRSVAPVLSQLLDSGAQERFPALRNPFLKLMICKSLLNLKIPDP
ncbi:uncharacterized protein [Drosophila suzukii]|uniref:Titin-like n=1 Tax=Drosophila suzukii TaxID=28584 RepID=A0AB39ZRX3_DROSZ